MFYALARFPVYYSVKRKIQSDLLYYRTAAYL